MLLGNTKSRVRATSMTFSLGRRAGSARAQILDTRHENGGSRLNGVRVGDAVDRRELGRGGAKVLSDIIEVISADDGIRAESGMSDVYFASASGLGQAREGAYSVE